MVDCIAHPPLPLRALRLGQTMGAPRPRHPEGHEGADLIAPRGTVVSAIMAGVVAHAKPDGSPHFTGYGNVVVLEHAGQIWSLYAHLDRLDASEGWSVPAGEPLGTLGSTGTSTGPHVHLAFATKPWPKRYGLGRLDPLDIMESLGLVFSSRERGARAHLIAGSPMAVCAAVAEPPPRAPPRAPSTLDPETWGVTMESPPAPLPRVQAPPASEDLELAREAQPEGAGGGLLVPLLVVGAAGLVLYAVTR